MKTIILQIGILLLCLIGTNDAFATEYGWIQKADFGSHGRHRGNHMSIGNRGYMGMGHYNGAGPNIVMKDWWEYDPATNSWTQRADYIGNNGFGNYACLAFGMSEYGYMGGGQSGSDMNLYRFDPTTNTWTSMGPMPMYYSNNEGFVLNEKGYALSGSTLREYNPQTNSWTPKANMPFSVSTWNSCFAVDGKGYVKLNNSLWEYKPLLDQWVSRAPFPGIASGGSASFAQNQKGYIICGYGGSLSNVQSEVWEFNPALNSWTQLPDFPGSSRRFCSAFSVNNRAYFGIGTNGTNFNDFWEFKGDQIYADVPSLSSDVHFTCGPNPSIDHISFSSEELDKFSIRVYTMSGEFVTELQSDNSQCEMNRDGLASGTYIYEVHQDNRPLFTNRFIFN